MLADRLPASSTLERSLGVLLLEPTITIVQHHGSSLSNGTGFPEALVPLRKCAWPARVYDITTAGMRDTDCPGFMLAAPYIGSRVDDCVSSLFP